MEQANTEKLIQEAAEFAAWSVVAGIATVSIYDRRGILKKNARSLRIFTSLRIREFAPHQRHRVSVRLNGQESLAREDPDGEPPSLTIYLLSEEDGRHTLGSIAEALSEKVKAGEVSIAEISVGLLAGKLQSSVMPLPDLVVVFGPEMKFDGYPPWHLQQAEMDTLPDNDTFSYVAFAHALHQFATAEMRHGK